jgi:hypothetical protein
MAQHKSSRRKKSSSSSRRKKSTSSRRKKGSSSRRYSKSASNEVRTEMHHLKKGKHGKRLKSRKQAVAIGLSKARRKGKKVPKKSSSKKS